MVKVSWVPKHWAWRRFSPLVTGEAGLAFVALEQVRVVLVGRLPLVAWPALSNQQRLTFVGAPASLWDWPKIGQPASDRAGHRPWRRRLLGGCRSSPGQLPPTLAADLCLHRRSSFLASRSGPAN